MQFLPKLAAVIKRGGSWRYGRLVTPRGRGGYDGGDRPRTLRRSDGRSGSGRLELAMSRRGAWVV